MSDRDATDPDSWTLAERIEFFKDATAGLKAISDNHEATVAELTQLRADMEAVYLWSFRLTPESWESRTEEVKAAFFRAGVRMRERGVKP